MSLINGNRVVIFIPKCSVMTKKQYTDVYRFDEKYMIVALDFTYSCNQTAHLYDAMGNRIKPTYYTRKATAAISVGNILEPEDSISNYYVTREGFNDNIIYQNIFDGWTTKYIKNPEGYIWDLTQNEFYPCYYIKDHIGNVRETWIYPWEGYKECIQRTQYYPSGLPWNVGYDASLQPYKYNGKEFVEMHGQDEYDSHARWYYPAAMRTTTMDPLCEKYYDISPYAWCGNNTVNYIDANGMDTLLFNAEGVFKERIIAGGSHVGRIIKENGSLYDFRFINQSDANRFGEEYYNMYWNGEIDKTQDNYPLQGIKLVPEAQIFNLIVQSGAIPHAKLAHAIKDAYLLSRGTNAPFDYTSYSNSVIKTNENDFLYIAEHTSVAQDRSNFGNFLWGYAMHSMKIPLMLSLAGAHFDILKTTWNNSNHKEIKFDSLDDQLSIILGYYYKK